MTFTLCVRKFSQYEMVVTQWAFVGPALLWPDKLGISVTSPETEEVGTNRFTAVISYILLLICQKLNLCIFLYSLNLFPGSGGSGARDVPGWPGARHQGGAQHVRRGPGRGQGGRQGDPHQRDTGQ